VFPRKQLGRKDSASDTNLKGTKPILVPLLKKMRMLIAVSVQNPRWEYLQISGVTSAFDICSSDRASSSMGLSRRHGIRGVVPPFIP
jgi:hypothetical protein